MHADLRFGFDECWVPGSPARALDCRHLSAVRLGFEGLGF